MLNTVYAPTTVTEAETFLWYQATPRLAVGVAHLWKQNAFRYLAAYQLVPEKADMPMVNVSAGVQGIGTGNPGFALTAEKNFPMYAGAKLNVFGGLGWRTNESHSHPVGGIKYTPDGRLFLGVQHDGHETHPFVTYVRNGLIGGAYLINGKRMALMVGVRF